VRSESGRARKVANEVGGKRSLTFGAVGRSHLLGMPLQSPRTAPGHVRMGEHASHGLASKRGSQPYTSVQQSTGPGFASALVVCGWGGGGGWWACFGVQAQKYELAALPDADFFSIVFLLFVSNSRQI